MTFAYLKVYLQVEKSLLVKEIKKKLKVLNSKIQTLISYMQITQFFFQPHETSALIHLSFVTLLNKVRGKILTRYFFLRLLKQQVGSKECYVLSFKEFFLYQQWYQDIARGFVILAISKYHCQYRKNSLNDSTQHSLEPTQILS